MPSWDLCCAKELARGELLPAGSTSLQLSPAAGWEVKRDCSNILGVHPVLDRQGRMSKGRG